MPQDRFFLADRIGEGSFGSVSLVYRESDGKSFAAKVFAPDGDDGTIDCAAMRELSALIALQREARSEKRGPHPHVMPVISVTEIEGIDGVCMVMPKFCMDATRALVTQALTKPRALKLARGLMDAVAYLHANHIIHRDIKLDNILLDRHFSPVLADFSLAKVLIQGAAGVDPAVTRSGKRGSFTTMDTVSTTAVGTPTYMAPEVVNGDGRYGLAADIWSSGVCLYEVFKGEQLASTKDKSALREIAEIREKLSTAKAMPRLVRAMLDLEPRERPSAVDALELLCAECGVRCAKPEAHAYFAQLGDFDAEGVLQPLPAANMANKKVRVSASGKGRPVRGGDARAAETAAACRTIDAKHRLTYLMARRVASRTDAAPMHSALMCAKMFELELPDMDTLVDEGHVHDEDVYRADEHTVLAALGWTLYV